LKLPIIIKSDWFLRVISKVNDIDTRGIEYLPFIAIVAEDATPIEINHETIHFYQMMETLIVGYYLIYLVNYLWLRRNYNHKEAYRRILLEVEAYKNDSNLDYLKTRKLFAWIRN
jgi:purine-cytosine permease-like protein